MQKQVAVRYAGGNTTERIHAKGAEINGPAWLTINMALADNMRMYVDIGDIAIREMLSRAALVTLVSLTTTRHIHNAHHSKKDH
jgi:hypothetical protein